MPRRPSPTLTEAELRVMEVLWRLERATVAEVTEALPPPPIAYNSVLTTLRILEQKGHVAHEEAGRAFVYRPLIARERAASSAVKNVVEKFFGNNSGELALRLIESERPSDEELARLRSLIERYEEK
ncbi:MAG TPA: BlaI/MecI/CopY family transcriptional regulator [Candidatus Baltobacteraceae bacterium]|nr:BlaI/MecI/CopY family transcriptional regulator [Candidatus Baltobacteraceae bacterium]